MIEVMKLILGKHFTNNSTNMPKLSKRQLHSWKNFLSLQKHLDDNGRYRRHIVLNNKINELNEISLWAQFYWDGLGLDKVTPSNSLYVHL